MSDIHVSNQGSIWLVEPLTEAALEWVKDHVDPDHQTWGRSIVVEPRYVHDLVTGMRDDGLEVA